MNKQYKDKFGYIHEVPTKENEVTKLKDMMNEARYLASSDKNTPSKYGEFPKTFFDRVKNEE